MDLGPTLFSFINDLGDKVECTHFLEDTKLGGEVGKPEGCADIHGVGTGRRIEPTAIS